MQKILLKEKKEFETQRNAVFDSSLLVDQRRQNEMVQGC